MRSSMPNTTSSNISCRHSSPPWIPAWTTTTLKTIPPGRAKASRFLLKEPPIIADRAMAAYRRNSTGPRTIAGKLRASYNALRHGLAASDPRRLVPPGAAERLAGAICDGDEDPVLFTAALAIAENGLVLDAIRRQKIIVIERLRETTSIALRKGDNSLTVAKARFLQAWLAHREIGLLVPKVMKKYQDQLTPAVEGDDGVVPIRVKALLEESEPTEEEHQRVLELARTEIARRERNEYDALEEAVPDLIRLERYEQRCHQQARELGRQTWAERKARRVQVREDTRRKVE